MRSPAGTSQMVECDQDLVSQINSVKVSICTLRKRTKHGVGEKEEEDVKAVLGGVRDHMISLDITIRSGGNTKIKAREEVIEETTKLAETT